MSFLRLLGYFPTMNTRTEIFEAMDGRRGDSAPPAVFTQSATVSQMTPDASWPEAVFEADKMAELSLQLSRRYGFATAKVPFCITVETERAGAVIDGGSGDRQPAVVDSPYYSDVFPDVPDFLPPEEFVSGGRCPVVREAAELIRKRNDDLFLVTGTVDPFTVAYQLVGVENFLVGIMMEPDKAQAWVDALTPHIVENAKRLSEVSDDVQIIAEASEEILPPEYFEGIIGEPVRKVVSAVKCYSTIHSCGETGSVLEELASLGETGLSVETVSDPEEIYEKLSGKVRLLGGVSPVSGLMQGTPDEVRASARRYSEIGYDLITPECGVPPTTPDENLLALAHYRN